jgi:MFS family permease
MTGFRQLARNHDFTLLWIGSTVSELGSRVSLLAFPLLAYALTGSTGWSAAAEALYLVGMVASLLPAGVLADRCDRRRVMRAVSLAGVVLYASLVAGGLTIGLTIGHVLVVALLTGVGAGAFQPAETSAVRTVVATEELPTALAQQQARQHVAALVGGPVGGALYAGLRWLPFAADAASYLLCWLLLGRIRTDLAAAEPAGGLSSVRREIASGLRFTWSRPFFRVLLIWSPLVNLSVNALFFVALLRLIRAGYPAVQIGLVETAVGVFGILGALAAPWIIDRTRTGTITILVAWSFVPLSIPLALWNHPLVMCASVSLGLFVNPAGNAGVGSYRLAVTPPDLVGRVQSAMQFVSMIAMPLAPALAGVLLGLVGGTEAILALTVLTAAIALIPTLSASVRSIPRPAHWNVVPPSPPSAPSPVTSRAGAPA